MKALSDCVILVVDDVAENIEILVEALDDYEVRVAMDGKTALEAVADEKPDLILLDIMMPIMDGYETCQRLKSNPGTADIPVIFLTALTDIENKTKGFEIGGVDYITKPFEIMEVQARVKTHLSLVLAKHELKKQNETLEIKVKERTKELSLTQEVTIEAMAALAEYRDPETGGHIRRTKNYVRLLAQKLATRPEFSQNLDPATIDLLWLSAPLHDIGKVGVPDHILLKPDRLTAEEFEEMKKHTIYGHEAIAAAESKLGDNSFLRLAKEIALTHQEKWDGTGYPHSLAGKDIPLSGRLMALADVYDALISKRVYKKPFPHAKAVEIILEGKGRHFDPDMVDAFMEIQEDFRQVALKYSDFEEERETLSQPYTPPAGR